MTTEEAYRLEGLQYFLGTDTIKCIKRNCDLTDILINKSITSYQFLLECTVSPKFIKSMISYGKKRRVLPLSIKNIMLAIREALLTIEDEEGNFLDFENYTISFLHIIRGDENPVYVSHLIGRLRRNGVSTMGELLSLTKEELSSLSWIGETNIKLLFDILNYNRFSFVEIDNYFTNMGGAKVD